MLYSCTHTATVGVKGLITVCDTSTVSGRLREATAYAGRRRSLRVWCIWRPSCRCDRVARRYTRYVFFSDRQTAETTAGAITIHLAVRRTDGRTSHFVLAPYAYGESVLGDSISLAAPARFRADRIDTFQNIETI